MSDLAERSKVNLDLWNLFIAIVSFSFNFNISNENNDKGFYSFQKNIPFKCIRKQI